MIIVSTFQTIPSVKSIMKTSIMKTSITTMSKKSIMMRKRTIYSGANSDRMMKNVKIMSTMTKTTMIMKNTVRTGQRTPPATTKTRRIRTMMTMKKNIMTRMMI